MITLILVCYLAICIPFWISKTYYMYQIVENGLLMEEEYNNEDILVARLSSIADYIMQKEYTPRMVTYWTVITLLSMLFATMFIFTPKYHLNLLSCCMKGEFVSVISYLEEHIFEGE